VSCTVTRRIQNVGDTCATDVHATIITPLDSGGNILATYSWVHIPNKDATIRPVEIRLVAYAVTQAASRWSITAGWRQWRVKSLPAKVAHDVANVIRSDSG
jgi:hypothetical protein